MDISCIILAGGRSTRMGKDKKLLQLKGKTFLETIIESAKEFSSDIIVSLGSKDQYQNIGFLSPSKPVIDEKAGEGPMMGLLSSLKNCKHPVAAVIPVDSPLINPDVYQKMFKALGNYDGVVPKQGSYINPLHGVYRVPPLLKALKKSWELNERGVYKAVLNLENVNYIDYEEFKKIDKNLRTFKNINTQKELLELQKSFKD